MCTSNHGSGSTNYDEACGNHPLACASSEGRETRTGLAKATIWCSVNSYASSSRTVT